MTSRPSPRTLAASRRRRRNRRLLKRVRLVAFIASLVLLVFAGSHLSAAEQDQSPRPEPQQPRQAKPSKTEPPLQEHPRLREPGELTAKPAGNPKQVDAESASERESSDPQPAATQRVAAQRVVADLEHVESKPEAVAKAAELPFTGEPHLAPLVASGCLLLLLGMLVQIAAQPLPARARTCHAPER